MNNPLVLDVPATAGATGQPVRSDRRWYWLAAFVTPIVLMPVAFWLAGGSTGENPLPKRAAALSGLVLIASLATCAVTDFRRKKIYNWATYPAVLWLLAINAYGSYVQPEAGLGWFQFADAWFVGPEWLGAVGISQSLSGAVMCFVVLFIAFQLARRGAGDVKLATVMGAALGMRGGVLAVALTYIIAGAVMLCWSIWEQGPLLLAGGFARKVGSLLFPLWVNPPTQSQTLLLQKGVPLGPFFAIGAGIVLGGLQL